MNNRPLGVNILIVLLGISISISAIFLLFFDYIYEEIELFFPFLLELLPSLEYYFVISLVIGIIKMIGFFYRKPTAKKMIEILAAIGLVKYLILIPDPLALIGVLHVVILLYMRRPAAKKYFGVTH